MVVQAWEAKAGGSQVPGQPELYRDLVSKLKKKKNLGVFNTCFLTCIFIHADQDSVLAKWVGT
jgi:predicted ATP-dependent Lon-type protease